MGRGFHVDRVRKLHRAPRRVVGWLIYVNSFVWRVTIAYRGATI
jgi:hypothetical protein